MTLAVDLGIIGVLIVTFMLGMLIGIFLTLGAVQLIARIGWHVFVMSREE